MVINVTLLSERGEKGATYEYKSVWRNEVALLRWDVNGI